MAPSRPAARMLAAAVLLLAAAAPATAWGTGPWVNARATYYGRDAWALHTGSCGFGFICPNRWSGELASGYDVAAISDKSPLYNPPSSCGQCLEVACRSAIITDKYGVKYDRRGMCRGAPGSLNVKVKIVDTCPCSYAANAASNSRWCCGDYPHLDISEWSMRKLTDQIEQGVFAISYRTVDCDAPIANEAKLVGKLMPDPHADMKPKSLNCATQGALTTESNAKVRAVVKKPTPKPTRKLSAKLIAYRKALAEAKKHKHSPQFYKNLEAYFAKRGPDMKRLDGKPSAPFNAAGRKLR